MQHDVRRRSLHREWRVRTVLVRCTPDHIDQHQFRKIERRFAALTLQD